jgi:hypothetical protein
MAPAVAAASRTGPAQLGGHSRQAPDSRHYAWPSQPLPDLTGYCLANARLGRSPPRASRGVAGRADPTHGLRPVLAWRAPTQTATVRLTDKEKTTSSALAAWSVYAWTAPGSRPRGTRQLDPRHRGRRSSPHVTATKRNTHTSRPDPSPILTCPRPRWATSAL